MARPCQGPGRPWQGIAMAPAVLGKALPRARPALARPCHGPGRPWQGLFGPLFGILCWSAGALFFGLLGLLFLVCWGSWFWSVGARCVFWLAGARVFLGCVRCFGFVCWFLCWFTFWFQMCVFVCECMVGSSLFGVCVLCVCFGLPVFGAVFGFVVFLVFGFLWCLTFCLQMCVCILWLNWADLSMPRRRRCPRQCLAEGPGAFANALPGAGRPWQGIATGQAGRGNTLPRARSALARCCLGPGRSWQCFAKGPAGLGKALPRARLAWQCLAKGKASLGKALPRKRPAMAKPCQGPGRPWQGIATGPALLGKALPRARPALAKPCHGHCPQRQCHANGQAGLGEALPRAGLARHGIAPGRAGFGEASPGTRPALARLQRARPA